MSRKLGGMSQKILLLKTKKYNGMDVWVRKMVILESNRCLLCDSN